MKRNGEEKHLKKPPENRSIQSFLKKYPTPLKVKVWWDQDQDQDQGAEPHSCWLLSRLLTACSSSSEYSSSSAAVLASLTPPTPPRGRLSSSALMAWKASDRTTDIWCWSWWVESSREEPLTCGGESKRERVRVVMSPMTSPMMSLIRTYPPEQVGGSPEAALQLIGQSPAGLHTEWLV